MILNQIIILKAIIHFIKRLYRLSHMKLIILRVMNTMIQYILLVARIIME
jgi:hypothetical protein